MKPLRVAGFALTLVGLALSLSLPALALFGREQPQTENLAVPVAESFHLTTYRNVAVSGTFAALDPEGAPVTFRLTRRPARGEITFAREGSARFTYTPYADKTGRDKFTYVAEDADGNVSQPATVTVRIQPPATSVRYADLDCHSAQRAAIALAEAGVYTGDRVGQVYFFRPDTPVSREEFLAMAMAATGQGSQDRASATGFADQSAISPWARPYVAAAFRAGTVRGTGEGCFAPKRPVTRMEAAVLLDRMLRTGDVAAAPTLSPDVAPAWAYQAVVNLSALGVLDPTEMGDETGDAQLTRSDAAKMLLSAREVLDF